MRFSRDSRTHSGLNTTKREFPFRRREGAPEREAGLWMEERRGGLCHPQRSGWYWKVLAPIIHGWGFDR